MTSVYLKIGCWRCSFRFLASAGEVVFGTTRDGGGGIAFALGTSPLIRVLPSALCRGMSRVDILDSIMDLQDQRIRWAILDWNFGSVES